MPPVTATGLIGIPCSDTGRFSAFSESLGNLRRPEGTELRFAVSTWRHYARNQLVEWMFELDAEWLLMIDDDQTFAPDSLAQLLSHEKDIVAALCLRRSEPYGPFCFSEEHEGIYRALDLREHDAVLTRVAAVGTGMMLIRRNVFETIKKPWFTITPNSGEDMLFCKEARRAGFEIYCDLGCPIGHLTTTAVLPVKTASGWKVGMLVSGETKITRDLPKPDDLTA
jgi:hypothetical protein